MVKWYLCQEFTTAFSGDAFLKYLSSVYIFVTNPTQKEGAMHYARQRIISNKSLLHNAIRAGLPPYIQSRPFTTKSWQPPNFIMGPSSPLAITETRKESNMSTEATNTPFDPQRQDQQNQGSFGNVGNQGPEKRSKTKRQQDENIQWLGDKVRSQNLQYGLNVTTYWIIP
jgi:endoribonuclease Dicer